MGLRRFFLLSLFSVFLLSSQPKPLPAQLRTNIPNLSVAVEYTVDTLVDQRPIPGQTYCTIQANDCSLRQALWQAHQLPASSSPTIRFGVSGTFALTQIANPTTQDLLTGDLNISRSMNIRGNGPDRTIIDGAQIRQRILRVAFPAEVIVSDVTLQNGLGDPGGCILNGSGGIRQARGFLRLERVVVRNCSAAAFGSGGGIANDGTMFIESSLIVGNQAFDGGGIFNESTSGLQINHSSIVDNNSSAAANLGNGGGIFNRFGTMLINNSSIFNNRARFGGGISQEGGSVGIAYSTIAQNGATESGGGYFLSTSPNQPYLARLHASIFAENTAPRGSDCFAPPGSPLESENFNHVSNSACQILPPGIIIFRDEFGDAANPLPAILEPRIDEPLASYRPLRRGASRIDVVLEPTCEGYLGALNFAVPSRGLALTQDQRGLPRRLGSSCNAGAIEGYCGDGTVQSNEQCDDGNPLDVDSCSNTCRTRTPIDLSQTPGTPTVTTETTVSTAPLPPRTVPGTPAAPPAAGTITPATPITPPPPGTGTGPAFPPSIPAVPGAAAGAGGVVPPGTAPAPAGGVGAVGGGGAAAAGGPADAAVPAAPVGRRGDPESSPSDLNAVGAAPGGALPPPQPPPPPTPEPQAGGDSGCSCNIARQTPTVSFLWIVLPLAAIAIRRSRLRGRVR